MDVRKIPVPILLALGLGGCNDKVACLSNHCLADVEGTSTTGPCLSPCLEPDVGPCLLDLGGPCLQPPLTTGETDGGSTDDTGTGSTGDTGTGSTGDTGTGSTGDTGTGTGGDATARNDVLERLRVRGVLPDDVAARLARPPTKKA